MAVVSNSHMRKRWRFALVFWGLSLFALLTYHSARLNREVHKGQPSRYFWWGAVRLDSDPLNTHSPARTVHPCNDQPANCTSWDLDDRLVDSGLIERALFLSALPPFVLCISVVRGAARFGISEVMTFMLTMPTLVIVWFYWLGWLLDRRRYKRHARSAETTPYLA
jgi:hypothetical protein